MQFSKLKIKCTLVFTVTIFFHLITINNLYAQNSTLRYFLLKPSAASMALGGSGVSYYNNVFSAHYNPALLTENQSLSFSGSYVNPLPFFDAIEHFYIGNSLNINGNHFIAVTVNFFKQPAQQLTDTEGNVQGSDGSGNDNYHYLVKASYAYDLFKNISFGLGIGRYDILLAKGVVGAENAEAETSGFTFDMGIYIKNLFQEATIVLPDIQLPSIISEWARFKTKTGFQAGLSFTNFGQDVSFIDKAQEDPLPSVLLSGFSYWLISSNAISSILIFEIENQVYEDPFIDIIRYGIDLNTYQILNVRAGYVNGMDKFRKSFPTFGIGINTKFIEFNISRYNSTLQPIWHYDVSLNLEL